MRLFCVVFIILLIYLYGLRNDSRPRPATFTQDQLDHYMKILKKMEGLFPQHIKSQRALRVNADVSNKIGVYREIPDTTPDECKGRHYYTDNMPTASIVISFHDEIWSVIARTVTSVFFRTPHHLLEDIIVVDDASTLESSIEPLESFLKVIPKVKLIRNPSRQGLVRTRMNGARAAKGDVLIFLDAHTEVNDRWLEPLMETIQLDPTVMLSSGIDTINMETFSYSNIKDTNWIGGFTWKYIYIWKEIPEHFEKLRKSKVDPVYTPTFVACVIVVDRKHFFSTGAFDEDMMIWGGENLEISFRYWMCAGGVKFVPCSKVGHVFRNFIPYTIPRVGSVDRNYQRSADVWMDEYGKFYYAASHLR